MKRYIHANQDLRDEYYKFKMPNGGTYRFAGKVDSVRGFMWGEISKIAPYDDAEYVWAKISGNGQVKYIQDGKVIDKAQMWSYEDEDYENVDDYFSDIINEAAKDLVRYNKDIEPRMVHN